MPLHPLTYTRDAATGPMLTGGRAEAVCPGGGRGVNSPPPLKIFIFYASPRAQLRLTYGLAVPPGMAGPLCFRAFTSHDNSNYKHF